MNTYVKRFSSSYPHSLIDSINRYCDTSNRHPLSISVACDRHGTYDAFVVLVDEPVKHGRCPYCEGENNDFIPLNQTVEYSGIEMSLNRQGMLRVRVYEPGKATFTTQDIVEIKRCPNCGAKMDGGAENGE